MNKTLLFLIALFAQQLVVTSQNTADFKVFTPGKKQSNVTPFLESLIGEGVVLKNYSITKTSSDEAYGFFEDTKERLGMKKGLVMSTGGVVALSSKNSSPSMSNNTHARAENRTGQLKQDGEPCLERLVADQKTFDACVIELDLVATADTLSFNYVFGSEEYDEFVGSNYNDVFAFFISGPDIDKPHNLALVPHTNIPVSVNTINNGSSANSYKSRPNNSTYYISNTDGHIGIEYDGMTKLMQIRQKVVPYETYHIKLAIADVGDDSYDSGVFIEGKSFVSYDKTYHVFFDKNERTIERGYETLLANLSADYKKHPESKWIITGHTDNEGDAAYNQKLSCERATDVAAYLEKYGVPKDHLIIDCKGESMPAYDNTTDIGKQNNRRVELKLAGNKQSYVSKSTVTNKLKTDSVIGSKLIKNFPNPFVESTILSAYVQQNVASAQIVITDITGKVIRTIHLLERGETSAVFDANGLSKGLYIATLVADGQSSGTVKMLLE